MCASNDILSDSTHPVMYKSVAQLCSYTVQHSEAPSWI